MMNMRNYRLTALGVAALLSLAASMPHAELCSSTSTADNAASGNNLTGIVAPMTGGDSSLGYSAAATLPNQGATVVIAAHNLAKAQQAAERISNLSGVNASAMSIDLSSLESVRNFAQDFKRKFWGINYLFNNAGILGSGALPQLTADGFESVFEVNYLGHFLLTGLLLLMLQNSTPARVVNTASTGHMVACAAVGAPDDCFKNWTDFIPPPLIGTPVYSNLTHRARNASTYGISKFAQIQHVTELTSCEAKLQSGVQAFSVAPGLVSTGMTNRTSTNVTQFCQQIAAFGMDQAVCLYSAQQGAAVMIATTLSADSADSGGWFTRHTNCFTRRAVHERGFTTDMHAKLYDRSMHWVGLT